MKRETPPIAVQPDHWQIVRDILQKLVPRHAVWAFGSRATGKAKPFSDLDLAIIGKEPLPLSLCAELREAFSESDLPWKVDIVDGSALGEDFRRIIAKSKVVVQQAGSETQNRLP